MSEKFINNTDSLLFYETRSSSFKRFPLWISSSIAEVCPNIKLNFLSNEIFDHNQRDILNKSFITEPNYCSVSTPTVGEFINVLRRLRPSTVIVFAHRIPDIALIVAAKSLSIKTVYYQHGLYIPFMQREASLFLRNLIKTFRYAAYAMSIGRYIGIGRIKGISAFLKIFLRGGSFRHEGFPADLTIADSCLVYGEHWVDYHKFEYGYNLDSIKIVGTPDLIGINLDSRDLKPLANKRDSICYVAQTLVEDGRLQREKMEIFLEGMAKSIRECETQLIVKLHPRSDISLYESLNCNIKLTHEFPAAQCYVGHYSTILIRGIAFSEKFLLVNYPRHCSPEYIKLLASVELSYTDFDKLSRCISESLHSPVDPEVIFDKRQKIKKYFHSNKENPFDRAAQAILHLSGT